MAYTAEKPSITPSTEELRQRIPGWGADLDPKDRPSVPRERFDPEGTGAHWDLPEQQPESSPHERSLEHGRLTPVFGTSCPPKGVSGMIRRYAYDRFSEARAAHWLLLMAADRVDALENHVDSLLSGRPDNPITETGIIAEWKYDGLGARLGGKRADVAHQWIDPIIVGAPWVIASKVAFSWARRLRRIGR